MLDEAGVTAAEIMTKDVAVVHPETPLLAAVKLMASRRISGVPVVDDAGTVIGILSEGDLVRWHEGHTEKQARWLDMLAKGFHLAQSFLAGVWAERHKVKTVMSPGCISVPGTMLARDVATLMHNKGIKRVPVLQDGKLVGIVARSDLIRALARVLDEKVPAPAAEFETVNEALRHGREELGIQPRGAMRKSEAAPQATSRT